MQNPQSPLKLEVDAALLDVDGHRISIGRSHFPDVEGLTAFRPKVIEGPDDIRARATALELLGVATPFVIREIYPDDPFGHQFDLRVDLDAEWVPKE